MVNPFDEDNDDFIRKARAGRGLEPTKSYTTTAAVGGSQSIEEQIAADEKEIERYLQASLDSTQRSRQQLGSSERLAESTASELLEQREKLERAEQNLDTIHQTTQHTQRSLNSLKSLFGGLLRNKLSRAPKEVVNQSQQPQQQQTRPLHSKLQTPTGAGATTTTPSSSSGKTGAAASQSLNASSRAYIEGTRWETMDNEIDNNLDSMSSQLNRLKTLGAALGDEVDDQNQMLDRIHKKTERNDGVIRSQEDQMRKLLG
uniref:t-SNARE coiled-coil homology domain-containing protein n=1 Tax=Globodera pallida TaxID=36090 RepID=A0A183C6B5_GLOPA